MTGWQLLGEHLQRRVRKPLRPGSYAEELARIR
jgi:hypothetical protein